MNINSRSYLLGAVLGSAVVLALGPAAVAGEDIYGGDYDGGLKGGYDVPPPPPTDRGIYLKAYIGQANPNVGNIYTPAFDNNTFTVFHKDIKSSPFYGLGIGYKRNHWMRFDLTGEYRGDALFVGQDSYPGADGTYNTGQPGPPAGFLPGTNEYTADISSWLGFVNAYWDIGTWCGFTPYVGAGIGFATVSVNGLKDVNVPTGGVTFSSDNTQTNFAWAFHAGMSYDVTPQFAVDLAYRYAQLGDAKGGVATNYDGTVDPTATLHIKDITSNDVMIGVRYKLQRETPVAYYPAK